MTNSAITDIQLENRTPSEDLQRAWCLQGGIVRGSKLGANALVVTSRESAAVVNGPDRSLDTGAARFGGLMIKFSYCAAEGLSRRRWLCIWVNRQLTYYHPKSQNRES